MSDKIDYVKYHPRIAQVGREPCPLPGGVQIPFPEGCLYWEARLVGRLSRRIAPVLQDAPKGSSVEWRLSHSLGRRA